MTLKYSLKLTNLIAQHMFIEHLLGVRHFSTLKEDTAGNKLSQILPPLLTRRQKLTKYEAKISSINILTV